MQRRCHVFLMVVLFVLSLAASVFAYETELENLSSSIAKSIAKRGIKRIAVVDFTDLQGDVTALGRFVAEEISVDFAKSSVRFEVIDRTHLKRIIAEHKFSLSGLVDPQTVKRLGKIAGVDALVIGSLTPFGDSIRVQCKVISVDTANVIGAGTTSFAKTRTIEQLLAQEIEATPKAKTPQQSREETDALDKLREAQRNLEIERKRLEGEKQKLADTERETARDRERLAKINEEQRKIDAERLRLEEESKKIVEQEKFITASSPHVRSGRSIGSKEEGEFLFELASAKDMGSQITIVVEATNKSGSERQLAFYDESVRNTKSKITDASDKTYEVVQVVLWQGDKRIPSAEAYRGIAVADKTTVIVEMIFRKGSSGARSLKVLNLHPYIATKFFFAYKWNEVDVNFSNVALSK